MSLAPRATAAFATLLLAGCASVPRDSGFGDVRRTVEAETHQPVAWDPQRKIEPPDDALIATMLEEPLTDDRAVQIAFANNRDLQATFEELGIARSELIAASTIRNPLLEAEVRFPGTPQRPFGIGISQTLMNIFNLGNRKKLGLAQFEAAKLRVGGAAIHFAAQVRTDYYDLLASRKILAREDTMMRAQEATAELALRQHEAGNISDLDLESEQSRYEQVKLNRARAQLEELQARERLSADMGLLDRADLKLPDEFEAAPEKEMDVAEVERQAVTRRLDIRMARQEIEIAERAASLAKTAAFDELSVGLHREGEPEGATTTGPSLTIPVPIFDRSTAQKTRARAMLRQAQQRLLALTVTARSEARSAQERLAEARARMKYLTDVVIPRRDRILKLTQLEYNAMLRSVFQLLEARQSLAQAQRDEVVATRDYWVARTELETVLQGVAQFSVRPEVSRPNPFAPKVQQGPKANH